MGFFDEMGKINGNGTNFLAGLAVNAVFHDGPVIFLAMVEQGQDQTDGTDIDMAVFVSPHL